MPTRDVNDRTREAHAGPDTPPARNPCDQPDRTGTPSGRAMALCGARTAHLDRGRLYRPRQRGPGAGTP